MLRIKKTIAHHYYHWQHTKYAQPNLTLPIFTCINNKSFTPYFVITAAQPIFITGAAGFMGSALLRRLVGANCPVAILLKHSTDTWRITDLLPHVQCCYGDLTDILGIEKLVRDLQPSGVFHLAASNIKSGINAPDDDLMRVNFLGTANLLRALQEIDYKFFINTGSFLEYGVQDHPVRETDRCEPGEVYSITKLASTLYGQALARQEKKPIITFRIFSPYGPAMERGRLVYELIVHALRGEAVSLTRPTIARDFIFVEDIVDIYMEAMTKAAHYPGEIFQVGTGTKTTLAEVVKTTLHLTKSTSPMQWGSFHSVAYDSDAWQADMTKTFSHFTWRPAHDVPQGLEATINWYRAHPSS